MFSNLRLAHKAALLVVIPAVFELLFGCGLFILLRQSEDNILREAHANTAIASANRVMKLFGDAATALFVYSATRSEVALQRYERMDRAIADTLLTLNLLVATDEKEREALAPVNEATENGIRLLHHSRSVLRKHSPSDQMHLIEQSGQLFQKIHDFTLYEQQVAASVSDAQSASRKLIFGFLVAGVLGGVCLAVGLAAAFNRHTLTRLNELMENVRRFGKGKEFTPAVSGTDEISQLDAVLRQATAQLKEADERKRQLVSMVAHDLRSPLMTVEITLSMLSKQMFGELPEDAVPQVVNAEVNIHRLIKLINDLLEVERIEAGQLKIEKETVMIQDLFEKTVASLQRFGESREVAIKFTPTEIEAECDPDRVLQVMFNLVANALKFSPAGSAVSMEAVELDRKTVEVRVRDEGRGVPAELREKIFERFSQAKTEDAKTGTGLGLSICKLIIESHGCQIGVRSPENAKGSEFWFTLDSVPSELEETESKVELADQSLQASKQ